ncbi:MAG: Abi family protein, partial [Collinsella sp.]
TKLVEKITDNRNEDGYSVLADYLTHLNHAERNRREGEISRLENDAYLGPLVERYPLDEMPAWVFLELSSFGAFASFYLFCANRWGDTEMRDDHYLLRRANSLRNAAAHSSAIINGLGISSATSTRYPASVAKALGDAGVSKRLRRSKSAIRECPDDGVTMPATVSSPESRRAYDGFWHLGNVRGELGLVQGDYHLGIRLSVKGFQAWLSQR